LMATTAIVRLVFLVDTVVHKWRTQMSVTFTKLFSSITASTVWCESSDTRVVWITMLAMADRYGRVWASIPGLAKEAVVSVDACEVAIAKFLAPDPYSRTKTAEGKRIEEIDGGWRLINHGKYRALRDLEERRSYKTEWQRQSRINKRVDSIVDNVDNCGPVRTGEDTGGHNAEAEAEAEADAKRGSRPVKKRRRRREPGSSLPEHARSWPPAFLEVLQPVGVRNLEGPTDMTAACLQADPDVKFEEILIGLEVEIPPALKLEQRGKIKSSTGGLVMGAVPKGVAAGTYKKIRAERERLRAEEAQQRRDQAENERIEIGWTQECEQMAAAEVRRRYPTSAALHEAKAEAIRTGCRNYDLLAKMMHTWNAKGKDDWAARALRDNVKKTMQLPSREEWAAQHPNEDADKSVSTQ